MVTLPLCRPWTSCLRASSCPATFLLCRCRAGSWAGLSRLLQALLSLYANGRDTGLVLDVGDGVAHTVPVYDGFMLPHAIEVMHPLRAPLTLCCQRQNLAGRSVTRWVAVLLEECGVALTTTADLQVAQEVKEQLCYVAADFRAEMAKLEDTDHSVAYSMPDGQQVAVRDHVIRGPELLFTPALEAGTPLLTWGQMTA